MSNFLPECREVGRMVSSAEVRPDSHAAWMGQIPGHWAVRRLKYLVEFSGGGTPSKGEPAFWGGDIPWVSPKDMKAELIEDSEDRITEEAVRSSATRMVPAGSVLVVVRSGILRHSIPVAITARPVALNQDMKALILNGECDPRFLKYVIRGSQRALLRAWTKTGATVESIEHELMANTLFPVPPMEEQRAIADFLDEKTAAIGGLIAKKERLIELIEERRQATITRAVTTGFDLDVPTKISGVEWLGKVPEEWNLFRLKHLVSQPDGIQMGPFGTSLTDLTSHDTGLKLYGQENTISGDFTAGHRWITPEQYEQLSRYELRAGDIVVTRKGSIGNCRIVPSGITPGVFDSDTIRVRVGPQVEARFLQRVLHDATYVRNQIFANRRGAILSGLNSSTIAEIWIAVPPKSEQLVVIGAIDRQTAAMDALVAEIGLQIEKLREYRQTLISAATTGRLDIHAEVELPA